MAFSIINYFIWEKTELTTHFMFVDLGVILGMHFLEKKLNNDKLMRQQEAKQTTSLREADKKATKGSDKSVRDSQKRADRAAHTDKAAKSRGHNPPAQSNVLGANKKGN
mmetsp:Transcript_15098/g.22235  ORF Transcript_15098/g.22235 Transcript_15098/m.22235 type:complete len:109 (+) Transcript_15098:169-495(+)|eukprot:CAMPEP_0195528764 /NCGR_PEP_ID=MMETSP0794_2-20130614/31060_1 /TAXON_ID=515487 /ORGANISM="Stephanopyxis turris, Strain CCMP 815" /LENGTH=108 /DNA_ID=CAMNT_0040659953 /DNA_START=152 /DNA_END=478 /DNA_ORIENTATION=+